MFKNKKVYKAHWYHNILVIIFPFFLTLPLFFSRGSIEHNKIIGISGFWVLSIILALAPFTMRLEIDGDEVKSYLFGFRILKLQSSNVKSITYGNLMKGGLGFGKGLIIRVNINGRGKTLTIGENLYGKEAIENIKSVFNSL